MTVQTNREENNGGFNVMFESLRQGYQAVDDVIDVRLIISLQVQPSIATDFLYNYISTGPRYMFHYYVQTS